MHYCGRNFEPILTCDILLFDCLSIIYMWKTFVPHFAFGWQGKMRSWWVQAWTKPISSTGFNASISYIESQLRENTNVMMVHHRAWAIRRTFFEMIQPSEQVNSKIDAHAPLQYSASGGVTENAELVLRCHWSLLEIARSSKRLHALEAGGVLGFNYEDKQPLLKVL